MSATPIPCLNQHYEKVATHGSDTHRPFARLGPRGCVLLAAGPKSIARGVAMDFRVRSLHSRPRKGTRSFEPPRSALDVGRPGLLDQLDHRIRHRNVVEVLGHLAALVEGELEDLV